MRNQRRKEIPHYQEKGSKKQPKRCELDLISYNVRGLNSESK